MKRAVHGNKDLKKLPEDTTELHIVRPVSAQNIEKALKKNPHIKSISISTSCFNRLSKKTKKTIKKNQISLQFETRRGRAIGIELERMLAIIELRKDFQPFRDIENTTGIPKSTAHYLIKYARREKIKKGTDTVYLT